VSSAHSERPPSVSVVGLGAMGRPIAASLQRAGYDPVLWNRSSAALAPFMASGARIADSPAEAAASIVLTVLTDTAAVRNVLGGPDGLLAGWAAVGIESPTLVVMGTVSPVEIVELASELAGEGVEVVDAPMSGGVRGAEEQRLSIMVGATNEQFEQLSPLFAVFGKIVRHLGPVGAGQLAKACNQLIVGSTVAAIAEASVLARAAGLDIPTLFDLLEGGLASSEVLRQKRARFVNEDFTPDGLARFQVKDLGFALAAAQERSVELPVAAVVRELFVELDEDGDGGLDNTAVYLAIQRRSQRNRKKAAHAPEPV
jgi:3-hydroxyisobutyrate dehydrogenase-like beta-hydroxyacid dehydrogenase